MCVWFAVGKRWKFGNKNEWRVPKIPDTRNWNYCTAYQVVCSKAQRAYGVYYYLAYNSSPGQDKNNYKNPTSSTTVGFGLNSDRVDSGRDCGINRRRLDSNMNCIYFVAPNSQRRLQRFVLTLAAKFRCNFFSFIDRRRYVRYTEWSFRVADIVKTSYFRRTTWIGRTRRRSRPSSLGPRVPLLRKEGFEKAIERSRCLNWK